MDLMVVADSLEQAQPLLHAVGEIDYRILKFIGPNDEVAHHVDKVPCEAIIFVCDEVEREELREMRSVSRECPKPILVLTRDSRQQSIDAAVNAGATAYVIDCADLSRLKSLLQVATARFVQQQALLDELDNARDALAQRKVIEKAKGIIMKQRDIDEDNAYKAIRKLAMDTNSKMHDVAGQIVNAAEVLL